jgi:hypothetical protein
MKLSDTIEVLLNRRGPGFMGRAQIRVSMKQSQRWRNTVSARSW